MLSGFGFSDEQPVLLADDGGPDGVPDGFVVDLDSALFEIHVAHGPNGQRVVDGTYHCAARKIATAELQAGDGLVALSDHVALAGSHSLTLLTSD